MNKNIYIASVIVVIIIIIIVVVISKYQETKSNFVNGMWINNKEDIFMYIDKEIKNGWRGGYLVSNKYDVNEPFKIKIDIGISDAIVAEVKKSKFLTPKMTSKIKLSDGLLEITTKDNKKIKLFKDNETSESMNNLST